MTAELSSDLGQVFAYSYTDLLFEAVPNSHIWGRTVDRLYQDLGDRLQLQQLTQDCRTESVSTVLVRRLEELGDTVGEVSDRLREFEQLGISLIALEEPIGSDQPLTRSDLLSLLQTIHQSQTSRKLKRGHAQNRIKTLPPPGKAPYGYRRGKDRYTIDRSTAPVVKDFFEHFLLYGSLRSSVRHLQRKYGKKISPSTAKRWLSSPVYRGDLQYQNGEVVQDTHAAILSRDEAAQVDRLLRRNRRMPRRSASAPRSLSGLVSCANCGSAMKISRVKPRYSQQEYLYLRPVNCERQPKCRAIAYQDVLEKTIDRVCQDLPQAVNQASLPNVEGIQQGIGGEIAAKQAIVEQLPVLVQQGILDAETADLRAYKLRTEMASLQAKLSQLPPANLKTIAQVVSIPQFWLDLSEAERRFYFREFIREIQFVREEKNWLIRLVFIF
ncbi:recombinase family protein [Leptolyngbya ohadii]|uniref:recombinase family protein n=1 Tax=Leptolyngbya ohadii TaxID=1962290 RepID=UPI000B59DBE0|nr:recombinase family protein [Leptolyngbya ohadii]